MDIWTQKEIARCAKLVSQDLGINRTNKGKQSRHEAIKIAGELININTRKPNKIYRAVSKYTEDETARQIATATLMIYLCISI